MIIHSRLKSLSGFQVVIEAALNAGSQSYFAAPSPFQSLLLNEGAMRFEEQHGSFIQAESPAAALAMAMGAAAVGTVPLVTVNEQDFLHLQEVLSYCCQQSRPVVIVVVANGPPGREHNWLQFQSLGYFFEPLLGSEQPLLSFLPSSLQQLWKTMGEAFATSLEHPQPTLLLLDPLLLMQQGPVDMSPLPSVKPRAQRAWPSSRTGTPLLQRDLVWPCERLWLAMGVLGEWVLQLQQPEWGVLCPQSLSPFPVQALKQCLAEGPEGLQTPIHVLEYQGAYLFSQLQKCLPELNWHSWVLPPPPEPVGLVHTLKAACATERQKP